jgi:SAM-dependent methyltransferase
LELGAAAGETTMGLRQRIANLANAALRPLGAQLVRCPGNEKPWDEAFRRWIEQAEASGRDPNEMGDREWGDDPLAQALERHYLPAIGEESVVLELGPGTGRLTRHIIGRCHSLILVDYSPLVCAWLRKYLAGKGRFVVHQIEAPRLAMVGSASVDAVLANGVFEHIDVDDLVCFLEEFERVLKPGGVVAFNFDNLMSPEGWAWFGSHRAAPGVRGIFRFYHPEMLQVIAERIGFRLRRMTTSASRFAYVELEKPSA